MNMMRTLRRFVVLIPVLFASTNVGAALVDNGNTTLDTSTNLEWLDLQLTWGATVDDLNGGLGGYFAAGYRHATISEVNALWLSEGISGLILAEGANGAGAFDGAHLAGAQLLFSLLGGVSVNELQRAVMQYDKSAGGIGYANADLNADSGAGVARGTLFQNDLGTQWQQASAGHLLVRSATTVPVPGAAWLLFSALAGLLFSKRISAP